MGFPMNEFFEKVWAAIPKFLEDLIGLCSNPREWLLNQTKEENSLGKATAFAALALTISYLIFLPPFLQYEKLVKFFPNIITFYGIEIAISSIVILIAWKLVGCRSRFKNFLIINCYATGVSYLINSFFSKIALGVWKSFDPNSLNFMFSEVSHFESFPLSNFNRIVSSPNTDILRFSEGLKLFMHSTTFLAVGSIMAFSLIIGLVWFWTYWKSFQDLTGANNTKSILALLIFFVFYFPVSWISFLMQK
jgi:hypothetical protein